MTLSVYTPYDSPSAYNAALAASCLSGTYATNLTAAYESVPLDYLHTELQGQVLTARFTLHHACTRMERDQSIRQNIKIMQDLYTDCNMRMEKLRGFIYAEAE